MAGLQIAGCIPSAAKTPYPAAKTPLRPTVLDPLWTVRTRTRENNGSAQSLFIKHQVGRVRR